MSKVKYVQNDEANSSRPIAKSQIVYLIFSSTGEIENIDFSKTVKETCYPINSSALNLVVTFVSHGNEKIELIHHL